MLAPAPDHGAEAPHCPCCGTTMKPHELMVSREFRLASFKGEVIHLDHQAVIILHALARAWPNHVTTSDLLGRIWDHLDEEPPQAKVLLRSAIWRLRKTLGALNVDIAVLWGEGYRLVMPQQTRIARYGVRRRTTDAQARAG